MRRRGLKEARKNVTKDLKEEVKTDDVKTETDADDVTCNVIALRGSRERWAVVPYVSLPDFLRDNEYLLKGHRPQLPTIKECFKSMFRHHTETWNIWTHFLGMLAFVLIALYMLTRPSSEVALDKKLVFSSFFIGAIFCLGCSALFHTLSCHSQYVSKIFAKLDYVGIIVLIVLSYPPWLHYGFRCRNVWKYIYFGSVGICGIACVIIVMKDRFSTPNYRWLRAVMFTALGMVGVVPGLHYILSEGWWEALVHAWWLIFMGLLYVGGALVYGARIPERLWPGKFDIVGQSHQIMHMCVIGGAFTCYFGARELAQHRIENDLMCV